MSFNSDFLCVYTQQWDCWIIWQNGTGGVNFPDFGLYYKASHQDSMVLAQRQKYRSMEQNKEPRDKSMDTLFLTKEAKIYNGEKTISLTGGAGKTGQPPVNKRN